MPQYLMNKEELVTKQDFEKLAQELIRLIKAAASSFDAKTSASVETFRKTLADVRAQVDSLFVEDKLMGMEKHNKSEMARMDKMHKEMMAELESEMRKIIDEKLEEMTSEIKKRAVPGKPGPKGDPGTITLELAEKAMSKPIEEFKKEWESKVQSMVESRRMVGGTPHNLVQYIDLSSQADGSRRTFTGTTNARFVPMVFLSGQNPVVLLAGTHYSIGRGSITLLNNVEPPASGVGVFAQIIK